MHVQRKSYLINVSYGPKSIAFFFILLKGTYLQKSWRNTFWRFNEPGTKERERTFIAGLKSNASFIARSLLISVFFATVENLLRFCRRFILFLHVYGGTPFIRFEIKIKNCICSPFAFTASWNNRSKQKQLPSCGFLFFLRCRKKYLMIKVWLQRINFIYCDGISKQNWYFLRAS